MEHVQNQVLRGFLAKLDVLPPLIFTFQYNPTSINDNKGVKFPDLQVEVSGNAPAKVYVGGDHRTITFDIKLHGLERGTNALNPTAFDNGISTELAKLRSFLYPASDPWGTLGVGGKRLTEPPSCYFGFGAKLLECVVTDITITETQFNSMLAPVRADVSVTLDVKENSDNALYQLDRQHRDRLAALGLQNVRIF